MIPVVLHHGLFGFGNLKVGKLRMAYFRGGIEEAIAARGHPLIVSRVHPTAGIPTRAQELKETILRRLDQMGLAAQPVVLIAHSLGGLDARYMISRLGMADHVRALVTVTTPHRGSPYADWCVRNIGERLGGLRLLENFGVNVDGVRAVTTEACRRFNDEVADASGVLYYSLSAARPWRQMPPFALHSYKVIFDAEGENDALVSVASSRWARHMGTWPADHFHTINRRFNFGVNDSTGDITPYYVKILDDLEADGVEIGARALAG